MSKDEQARVIGEQDYIDSKRKMAAIRAELQKHAEKYSKAVECLRAAATERDPERISSLAVASFENLPELISDLQSEMYRHAELLEKVRDFGLEG